MEDYYVAAAPNTSYFTPLQDPPVGTAFDPQSDGEPIPKLFQPIKIRGLKLQNRIMLSPMVQISGDNGKVTPWHMAHIAGILTFGPGLTFIEGAGVLPEGRVMPQDLGLWDDTQIEPLRQLVEYAHSQGQKIGIQLNHSGRKGSTVALCHAISTRAVGGWPDEIVAPSAIPYKEGEPVPRALDEAGIRRVVRGFVDAARRAIKAGVGVLEIHGAHGYLLYQFLSPVTNKRTDRYGGSFENRIRLPVEVVDAVRAIMPQDMPLFFRVSATDWLEKVAPNEPSWCSEDTIRLAEVLTNHGVDVYDVSSAGLDARQQIEFAEPAYQAPYAEAVKKRVGDKMLVASVGGVTDAHIAQHVLVDMGIDIIAVGRQFLRDHQTVWTFAEQLGVEIKLPNQVAWVFGGRGGVHKKSETGKNLGRDSENVVATRSKRVSFLRITMNRLKFSHYGSENIVAASGS
ncbi:FMN-linked oxidoreductase [Daedalea quercina L-15889]|uniref:FMN-linked oxidoreductase n=1 Tax=Daedalea quercina L-15889 TaxID=1314783 RepID=A0A165KIQ1_9APHY|nr:FMN-linked oxidoreductase [Daedalea quercina L-15889]